MHWPSIVVRSVALLNLCILSGCGEYFLKEHTAGKLDHAPRAVLILGARTNLPQKEMDVFHQNIKFELERCGLVVGIVAPDDPLALDPDSERARFTALRTQLAPDWILTYRETSSTAGHPRVAYFDAFVLSARRTMLWNGHFFMPEWDWMRPTTNPGDDVGTNLVTHPANAQLLGACKPASTS